MGQNSDPSSRAAKVPVSVRGLVAPTPREIQALAEIFDRYRVHYCEPSDTSESARWLEENLGTSRLRAFVAEDSEGFVGFALTMEVPASLRLARFWQIRDLFVLATHRRLGVGRALLASVRAAAVEAGAVRLVLQTEDDNDPALRLYADSGYVLVEGYRSLTLPLGPEPLVLETERLVLRPMTPDDLDALCEIFGDPIVMSAFDSAPLDREQVRGWLERNLDHQREHGFGLFAACSKDGGLLIGDCGLELMEIAGEEVAELGYDFRSDHWNQGYATEAACAVRDYAFGTLGLERLVSLIRIGNRASERVAEKTGLRKVEQLERFGRPYLRYEIEKSVTSTG